MSDLSRRALLHLLPGGLAAAAGLTLPAPARANGAPRRVIVLGAGLSGLAAALELRAAGHDVIVLEARNRPGGRVETLRAPFADGLHADAGGWLFTPSATLANRYIDDLGLRRASWAVREGLRPLFHLRGQRLIPDATGQADWPYALTQDERALGPYGLTGGIMNALPDGFADPEAWRAEVLSALDQTDMAGWLLARGWSTGAVDLVRATQWFGFTLDGGSALSAAMSDFAAMTGGMPFMLEGGNDALPKGMAARLGEAVIYDCQARAVRQHAQGVTVTAAHAGGQQEVTGDYLVCTLPATLVRELVFEPGLEGAQGEAAARLPYVGDTRTFLQVRRRFWEDEGLDGSAATDLPVGSVGLQPAYLGGSREDPILLESHVRGPGANEMARGGEAETIARVTGLMEAVHPGVSAHVEAGAVKCWSCDPHARGAYSFPAPGDVTRYLDVLRQPAGRVHFAGEHTSILRATMEGALRSGVRAAAQVMEASARD